MAGNWINCATKHRGFHEDTSRTGGPSAETKGHIFALTTLKRKRRSHQFAQISPFNSLKPEATQAESGRACLQTRDRQNARIKMLWGGADSEGLWHSRREASGSLTAVE
jgi:hypothetical protein